MNLLQILVPFIMIGMDSIWIFANQRWGVYRFLRGDNGDMSNGAALLCALIVWTNGSLYILFHPSSSNGMAFVDGMWLGVTVYSVFNATAYLTFQQWRHWVGPVPVALIDTMWGTLLYASISTINYSLSNAM